MLFTINSSSKLALIMLLHYYSIILLDSNASPSSKPPKELSQSLQRCDYWNSELSIPNVVYTSLYGNQFIIKIINIQVPSSCILVGARQ